MVAWTHCMLVHCTSAFVNNFLAGYLAKYLKLFFKAGPVINRIPSFPNLLREFRCVAVKMKQRTLILPEKPCNIALEARAHVETTTPHVMSLLLERLFLVVAV